MLTIKENCIFEQIIKKSKFIAVIYKVESVDEVNLIFNNVKKKYKNANHYCYAYIINNNEKFFDDGEPSGTAGLPILNSLRKEKVCNVICIVVRYFGGILLGSGGLIRAYASSCHKVIKSADLIAYEKTFQLVISFVYDNIKQVDHLLKNATIISKQFDNIVIYRCIISTTDYELISKNLQSTISQCQFL